MQILKKAIVTFGIAVAAVGPLIVGISAVVSSIVALSVNIPIALSLLKTFGIAVAGKIATGILSLISQLKNHRYRLVFARSNCAAVGAFAGLALAAGASLLAIKLYDYGFSSDFKDSCRYCETSSANCR